MQKQLWKKSLGILCQKCNSQVILKKMKRLTTSDEEEEEEHRDRQSSTH